MLETYYSRNQTFWVLSISNNFIVHHFSGCSDPLSPSSNCPVPWYRPEQGSYYYDSTIGNCQPYFNGEGCSTGTGNGGNADRNVYGSYQDCTNGCGNTFQPQPQQSIGKYAVILLTYSDYSVARLSELFLIKTMSKKAKNVF